MHPGFIGTWYCDEICANILEHTEQLEPLVE
jgi:hypothetical protein